MTRVTRRYRFSASHRLSLPNLTLEENLAKFGKCANPYGHGHNYDIEISIKGSINETTGRVVNLTTFDGYVHSRVVSVFDNKDMNHDVSDFFSRVPTTENLAYVISERLKREWPFESIKLDGVRIQETKRNFFELRNG